MEANAEDFLFHLYRGSELLAEGRFDGAREELDRALKLQPREAQAQDLLAKLYFKLGVYPRAIELYLEIARQFPDRIPPRVNLALAYLKTGQMRDVVTHLLPVVERDAEHERAWGYLGLAWSRLGEYAKAREAFVRAGHQNMARRMEEALEAQYGSGSAGAPRNSLAPASSVVDAPAAPVVSEAAGTDAPAASQGVSFDEMELAALESGGLSVDDGSLAPSPGPWTAREPGDVHARASVRGAAVSVSEFARRAAVSPRGGALELDAGSLVVVGGCAARIDANAIGVGLERGDELRRRGGEGGPMAGSPKLAWIRAGWAVLPPRSGASRVVLTLRDEDLVVCERSLAAFEGSLQYDNGAVDGAAIGLHVVTLRGRGRAALEVRGELRTLPASPSAAVTVPRDALVAWTRSLVPTLVASNGSPAASVKLEGEGIVVASIGEAVEPA